MLKEEKKEKETRELNLILFMGQQKSLLIFHKINLNEFQSSVLYN